MIAGEEDEDGKATEVDKNFYNDRIAMIHIT